MSDDLAAAKQESSCTIPIWYKTFYFSECFLGLILYSSSFSTFGLHFPFCWKMGDEAYGGRRMISNSVKNKYWSKQKGGIINKQSVGLLYMAL